MYPRALMMKRSVCRLILVALTVGISTFAVLETRGKLSSFLSVTGKSARRDASTGANMARFASATRRDAPTGVKVARFASATRRDAQDVQFRTSPASTKAQQESYLRRSTNTTEVLIPGKKTILYICDAFGCGGLADRQKAIVSSYVLAAMLKRDFRVHVTVPCDLANFMAPNKVDWRISKEELRRADIQRVSVIDNSGVTYVKELLKKDNLDREFPHNYTSFFWNMELVQYLREHRLAKQVPWLRDLSVPDVYRYVLDTLFSLKPELQRQLQTFRDLVPENTKLVCTQVRLGRHEGFPDSEKFYTVKEHVPTVTNFLRGFDDDAGRYRFLVTSDTEDVVNLTFAHFPNRTLKIPGPITHVDKARGANACDGLKKAILDEYALATCDVLVISESGLGKMASFWRGTNDDLYIFLGSKIEPFKRGSPFPKFKKDW